MGFGLHGQSGGGGGGGGIAGSIADEQIAFGVGFNTIGGSPNFTYDPITGGWRTAGVAGSYVIDPNGSGGTELTVAIFGENNKDVLTHLFAIGAGVSVLRIQSAGGEANFEMSAAGVFSLDYPLTVADDVLLTPHGAVLRIDAAGNIELVGYDTGDTERGEFGFDGIDGTAYVTGGNGGGALYFQFGDGATVLNAPMTDLTKDGGQILLQAGGGDAQWRGGSIVLNAGFSGGHDDGHVEANPTLVVTGPAGAASFSTDLGVPNTKLQYIAVAAGPDGNNITISYVDPGLANQALSIVVTGMDIVVNLATNGASAITSTATAVRNAINADMDASALVSASSLGTTTGIVIALAPTNLSNGLAALNVTGQSWLDGGAILTDGAGVLRTAGYQSSTGAPGITNPVVVGATATFEIENGLIIGVT